MALKDWKKLVNKKDMVIYKKTNVKERHHLQIYEQDYAGNSEKDWLVQALRYAKNYMKTH